MTIRAVLVSLEVKRYSCRDILFDSYVLAECRSAAGKEAPVAQGERAAAFSLSWSNRRGEVTKQVRGSPQRPGVTPYTIDRVTECGH